jgi:Ser/Thr protein kinase RdoA (MazF antagonist)
VEEALREEALAYFFPKEVTTTCTPTSGGVNNVVNYVNTSDGKRYILRIYNNGNKTVKVQCEHAILQQLQQQKLSFQVSKAREIHGSKYCTSMSSGNMQGITNRAA